MKKTLTRYWELLKETTTEWIEDDSFRLSASLSYFTIFSLAPLLIVLLFVVGLFWGGQSAGAQAEILSQVRDLTGDEGADLVATMLEGTRQSGGGVLATVLGALALLFGATGVFVQLQQSLNRIWNVESKGSGLKGMVIPRVLAFGLILGVGFLLLVSLVVSAALSALDAFTAGLAPGTHLFFQVLNLVLSFGVLTLLFAMIYRYLPDVEVAWRDVLVGGFITAVLFTLGKYAIGLYLGNSGVASAYGAAGSLVVLLLWIYYSSLIVFYGAEFTQVYARHYGSRIRPGENAVWARRPDHETPVAVPVPVAPAPLPRRRPPSRMKRSVILLGVFLLGRFLGRK